MIGTEICPFLMLERIDDIINTLDKIMKIKRTVFRPPKRCGFPASPKRFARGAMSCTKPTKPLRRNNED